MSNLKSVITKVSMIQIPEDAILHRIVEDLKGREAFVDVDDSQNEKIYYGDVFEVIGSEYGEFKKKQSSLCPQEKVFNQIDELAKLSDSEYVQIINCK